MILAHARRELFFFSRCLFHAGFRSRFNSFWTRCGKPSANLVAELSPGFHQSCHLWVIKVLSNCPVPHSFYGFVDNKQRNKEPFTRLYRSSEAVADFYVQLNFAEQ